MLTRNYRATFAEIIYFMTTPINLNKFRKAKVRADKETRAEANRVKFGLTKAEKQKLKTERDKAARKIDGHKLSDLNKDDKT